MAGACLNIVTREEWGAREPRSVSYLPKQPVPYVFIHHSAGAECFNKSACSKVVRGYQDFHMDVRGFCLSGDFTDHLPPKIQMDTVKMLIKCGVDMGKIDSNYTLRGHRDMKPSTACPGDALYAEIRTWPHYVTSDLTFEGASPTINISSLAKTEPTPSLNEVNQSSDSLEVTLANTVSAPVDIKPTPSQDQTSLNDVQLTITNQLSPSDDSKSLLPELKSSLYSSKQPIVNALPFIDDVKHSLAGTEAEAQSLLNHLKPTAGDLQSSVEVLESTVIDMQKTLLASNPTEVGMQTPLPHLRTTVTDVQSTFFSREDPRTECADIKAVLRDVKSTLDGVLTTIVGLQSTLAGVMTTVNDLQSKCAKPTESKTSVNPTMTEGKAILVEPIPYPALFQETSKTHVPVISSSVEVNTTSATQDKTMTKDVTHP
ncbi:flocculation protein FLO11-like [Biomphalaria glabrata]|uniref:Flocculation protein FLO11-like n=1 Tax=Biomphalaria glabrata TaxID=6526 RepID=A4L7H7_BIOGL|nr:flocculation protein FLO11-like [Biomphalaria glabrata]ABO40832.1 peptidoglycan recognition protein long form splice form 2 [Biomphalaria glabrata]